MNFFKKIFDKIKTTITNYINPVKKSQENISSEKEISSNKKGRYFEPILYVNAKEYEKHYLSNYTYVVQFSKLDGSTDFISVTSVNEMTYPQVIKKAVEIVQNNFNDEKKKEKYSEIDYSSFKIVIGVVNLE